MKKIFRSDAVQLHIPAALAWMLLILVLGVGLWAVGESAFEYNRAKAYQETQYYNYVGGDKVSMQQNLQKCLLSIK